uniref:Uncharacterized protein n=1 Tax=Arundo donax TaxID=35708 RepID=A0A0A9SV03_ARUDO
MVHELYVATITRAYIVKVAPVYFCTEKAIYLKDQWLNFSFHSRSGSETSSSGSSKASISAKYALYFFTNSSGNLCVLDEGRFFLAS